MSAWIITVIVVWLIAFLCGCAVGYRFSEESRRP